MRRPSAKDHGAPLLQRAAVMRAALWTIAWLGLGAAGATGLWLADDTRRVTMSTAQLQSLMNASLPHVRKAMTVERATISLDQATMTLEVAIKGAKLGHTYSAEVVATGVPAYDADRGSVVIEPSLIIMRNVEIDHAPLGNRPAETTQRRAGVPIAERSERIRHYVSDAGRAAVVETAAHALAVLPLHMLERDASGIVARATVRSLQIKDGALVVELEVWRLSKPVGLAILVLLAAFAFLGALARNPDWGFGGAVAEASYPA